jgi:hypothetical protein
MTSEPQWRYLSYGRVRHALNPTNPDRSYCGVYAWASWPWKGTGDATEKQRIADLPMCLHCTALMGGYS